MNVRRVSLALVSSVFFAALVANSGSALATDSSTLSAEAYQALSGGDAARAVTLYTTAIEARDLKAEMLANALLNRALAYQKTAQMDLAIDDYTSALNLDAMSPELRATALYNRGLAQQNTQHLPLAIEDFTASLLLNPTFPHAFLARANALRESGQYIFALSDYERALKYRHPEPARVYFGQAQAYAALRRPDDQHRMLALAKQADPNFSPANVALAALAKTSSIDTAASVDAIQTGSIDAAGGETTVQKLGLPKGVEPPSSLVNGTTQLDDALVAASETPLVTTAKKLFTDRIPAEDTAAIAAPVAVASVPAIPKAVQPAADNLTTASIVKPEPLIKKPAKPIADVAIERSSGWSIQVASATSEDMAWSTWKNMQKAHKVLAEQNAVVVKADLGAKGTFYRVRIQGFDDQQSATTGCAKFKAGGVSCYISKADG